MGRFKSFKNISAVTLVIFTLPIFICLVFKYSELSNIGPVTFFYSLAGLPVFSTIYSIYLSEKFSGCVGKILGAVLGVFSSVLLLNSFMFITHYLGIMNYVPM